MARAIGTVIDGGAKVFFAAAIIALVFIAIATIAEVASRYFFASPSVWVADISAVALAWSIALAAPEVARRRGHIAITILTEVGPAQVWRARLLEAISVIACAIAGTIVASEAWRQVEQGVTTQGATQVSKAWVTAAIALGLIWTALVFAKQAISLLRPDGQDR